MRYDARMLRHSTLPFLLLAVLLGACATPRGSSTPQLAPSQLAKSDIDRISDAHRRQLDVSLRALAEKLYKRNPREWKKAGLASHDAAMTRLFAQQDWRLPELGNLYGSEAILGALRPEYAGDRVAAYIAGIGGMMHQ